MEEEKKIHEEYYISKDSSQTLRYIWYAKKFFKNIEGKRILEIGCGDGGVVQFLKKENKVYGVDISKNAVKFLKQKGIESKLSDISKERLPFKDKSFDYVIILETLEHLKSPQFAIEEIQRVLRKNGIMIASIPNPRTKHKFIYPSLFKFYNFKEYLTNNGFVIKSVSKWGICPPFWGKMKEKIDGVWQNQKVLSKKTQNKPAKLSKLALYLSSNFYNKIKHHKFAWSFVYECINVNPQGAKELYFNIAEETKKAY